MKSHIGPNGPDKCDAKVRDCPYAPVEDHFSTIKEARIEHERRLEEAYADQTMANQKMKELSETDKHLREKTAKLAMKLVESRAQIGTIALENVNSKKAEASLKTAIDFAEKRNNVNMITRLSDAQVLPSSTFTFPQGRKFSATEAIAPYTAQKFVDFERNRIIDEIVKNAKHSAPSRSEFTYITAHANYELKFERALDKDVFNKLPAKTRHAIMSERETFSLDLARKNLDAKTFEAVTIDSQSIDYVINDVPSIGQGNYKPLVREDSTSSGGDKKVEEGLKNLDHLYSGSKRLWGSQAAMSKVLKNNNKAAKEIAARYDAENVFIPTQGQTNGLLVSRKKNLNKALINEKLNAKQLQSITTKVQEIDRAKARELLSDDLYRKLYGNVKAKVTVREVA